MKFRFLLDPLFVFCFVLYFVNRLLLKPYVPNTFSQNYLNDLILIPFWLPIMLFTMRLVRLRDTRPPRVHEVLIPLVLWSVWFEFILPYTAAFKGLSIADPYDILFYGLGALASILFWKLWYKRLHTTQSSANRLANQAATG